MDTHSGYDISTVQELGNKAIVNYRLYTGKDFTYENEDGSFETFFGRNVIKEGTVVFNYFPVAENDLIETLRALTKEFSDLPLVENC